MTDCLEMVHCTRRRIGSMGVTSWLPLTRLLSLLAWRPAAGSAPTDRGVLPQRVLPFCSYTHRSR